MLKSLDVKDLNTLHILQSRKAELSHIIGAGNINIDEKNHRLSFSYISKEAEQNFISKLNDIGIQVSENE